jgi:uncharacterized protein
LLPFTFRRLPGDTVLIVNQAGDFLFISSDDLNSLIDDSLTDTDVLAQNLHSKQIIAQSDLPLQIDLLATKLRTRKAYLRNFTSLHMVVLTAYCSCKCEYCQASSIAPEHETMNMSEETARKVVEMIFRSPSPIIKIEFQGGEPLINWQTLQFIVKFAESVNLKVKKNLDFVICTNLTMITEDILAFIREHNIMISTSLDGPQELHDLHRISRNGTSSYDAFVEKLAITRQMLGEHACSPLLTITKSNLYRLREVVDEYLSLGFTGIFLRTLNPYGLAKSSWNRLAYPVEEFVKAYKDILSYMIKVNLKGNRFVEYYTTLLLTRILTPFSTGFVDLQSPAGAGISGVIYDYDGSVYPTDESRMLARTGNFRFRLGNVHQDKYEVIFLGNTLRELIDHSCVETLPQCADCAYQLYCGADPVRNYVECGDIVGHRPTSEFCRKNMAVLDHLFSLLRENDEQTLNVFWSWITNRRLEDIIL